MMIAMNSVFAAYEIALASISIGTLENLVREGRRGAKAAKLMKDRMEGSLAVVQLGITLVAATAAATGGAGAEDGLEPVLMRWGIAEGTAKFLSIAIVVALLTVVTIIFGELVPKVFALRNKELVCLRLSPPMAWFSLAVWPAVWVLEKSVALIMRIAGAGDNLEADQNAMQELRGAAAVARMSRMIGHREEGIIVTATRLATTPLRNVMLPAEYIGMLSTNQSLAEALITAHQEMHTRFPVTERPGDPQHIIGYVNFKDIVAALRVSPKDPSIRALIRQIPTFRDDQAVSDVLETLIRDRNHIALVEGESRRIVGLVTLEDIVEELVGEIHDEFDRMPAFINATGNGWVAGGFVSLARIAEETGIVLPQHSDKPLYTLSDWIVDYLERPPHGGDEIKEPGYEISVRKVRNVLVQEAFIRKLESDPPAASLETPDDRPAVDAL